MWYVNKIALYNAHTILYYDILNPYPEYFTEYFTYDGVNFVFELLNYIFSQIKSLILMQQLLKCYYVCILIR